MQTNYTSADILCGRVLAILAMLHLNNNEIQMPKGVNQAVILCIKFVQK
jgi:hypothetical protein